eukprot:jgi/Galph1/1909/GphlegSOOS_G23.1
MAVWKGIILGCFVFIFLFLNLQPVHSFEFYLKKDSKMCFTEQIASNTKVSGEYAVTGSDGSMAVDFTVIGPDKRNTLPKWA